jgi:hypothetical protein
VAHWKKTAAMEVRWARPGSAPTWREALELAPDVVRVARWRGVVPLDLDLFFDPRRDALDETGRANARELTAHSLPTLKRITLRVKYGDQAFLEATLASSRRVGFVCENPRRAMRVARGLVTHVEADLMLVWKRYMQFGAQGAGEGEGEVGVPDVYTLTFSFHRKDDPTDSGFTGLGAAVRGTIEEHEAHQRSMLAFLGAAPPRRAPPRGHAAAVYVWSSGEISDERVRDFLLGRWT